MGLNDFVEDISVLIDGAPQPPLLTVDCDDDLVQMPNIAATRRFAPQAARIVWAELDRPTSYGFVGDDDTAFQQHFLDQAQTQRKSEIQPHCMGDDLRRETVTLSLTGARVMPTPYEPKRSCPVNVISPFDVLAARRVRETAPL